MLDDILEHFPEAPHPLSHAAIVAREYGIPAVLGVQRGTSVLRDGDRVRVDAARGVDERVVAA